MTTHAEEREAANPQLFFSSSDDDTNADPTRKKTI